MESKLKWIIKSFDELTTKELYAIVKSRFEVFVMEQTITCENDFDDIDYLCHHIFAYENDKVVAYARLIPKGIVYDTASIGRVLVLPMARRRGIAQKMMEQSTQFIVQQWEEEAITISAQQYIVPLYLSVGFDVISDVYEEAGIPHVKMKYRRF